MTNNEEHVGSVRAVRKSSRKKGTPPKPCVLDTKVHNGQVVLRAIDVSGVPSMAAVLEPSDAKELADHLRFAAEVGPISPA